MYKDSIYKMKRDFANLCNNPEKINPTIYLVMKEYEIDEKVILHVYVPESSNVHRTAGKVYDRNVDGDYEVTQAERIANIYLRKQEFYTENRIYPYAEMSDLRKDVIQRARQRAINRNGENHLWANMTDEQMLRSANLIAKDYTTGKEGLTLAAILLFGKDETILSVLPHHKTDAIYRVKNLDRYDDRDDIRTNLIDSFDRLMAFVDKHLDDRFYIENNQRIDVRNKIAREVCSNLLMHREFASPYPAKLIIEKDYLRTENANRAKMIGRITLSAYEPYPKNPKIAKVFKEIGLADELGSGVQNLYKYTPIYSDGAEPELKEDDIFRTIIPLNMPSSLKETSDEYIKDQQEYIKKPTRKYRKTTKKVSKKQQETNKKKSEISDEMIIKFCLKERSLKEIVEHFGYKDVANFRKRHINPLLRAKRLKMTIPNQPKNRNQKYYGE